MIKSAAAGRRDQTKGNRHGLGLAIDRHRDRAAPARNGDIPMPGTPNPLSDMGNLDNVVVSKDERPNPSFETSALPGFKKTVQGRRAIRIFDGVPIPEDVMRDCLRDAVLAPSASNLQCYEIYWVRDDEKKRQLAELCLGQPAATTAGDLIVIVSRVDQWQSHLKKLSGHHDRRRQETVERSRP